MFVVFVDFYDGRLEPFILVVWSDDGGHLNERLDLHSLRIDDPHSNRVGGYSHICGHHLDGDVLFVHLGDDPMTKTAGPLGYCVTYHDVTMEIGVGFDGF